MPENYQAWGNLGSAYLWAGGHEQSTHAYRKATDLAEAQSRNPLTIRASVLLADDYASADQRQ